MFVDLRMMDPVFFDEEEAMESNAIFQCSGELHYDMNIYSEIYSREKELDTPGLISVLMDYSVLDSFIDIEYECFRDISEILYLGKEIDIYEKISCAHLEIVPNYASFIRELYWYDQE